MKQPLRIDDTQREDDDVALYRRLIRDVCLLYHELSAYRHIMGDLDYAKDYPLEYWTLINRIDTGRSDDRFIRSGILVLLLAMLQDVFDGSGDYISRHANAIRANLSDSSLKMTRCFGSQNHSNMDWHCWLTRHRLMTDSIAMHVGSTTLSCGDTLRMVPPEPQPKDGRTKRCTRSRGAERLIMENRSPRPGERQRYVPTERSAWLTATSRDSARHSPDSLPF